MPYFESQNHRLFYREQGSGPLMLILPGNTASSACHVNELEYFGERFHAVSLDFLGTGQSDRSNPWPAHWWDWAAHDVAALVRHLGYETCIVVGTSGGAMVATLLAIQFQELVRGLIADSFLERFPREKLVREVEGRLQSLYEPGAIAFWKGAHGEDWEAVVKADNELLLRFEGREWLTGPLREIRCPTLLTGSLTDESIPVIGDQFLSIAQQIPDCRVFLVNQGSHPLMWSRAEEFRAAADAFLGQLSA